MMKNAKIARAVALAIAGTALGGVSAANAAVTTMYNLSTSSGASQATDPAAGGVWTSNFTGGTDGWANGADPGVGSAVGGTATQQWAGTAGSTAAAFGYGGAHLNWGFQITGGNGGSGTISTYDAKTRYGQYADIDVARGAWAALNTGATFAGWRHDLDVGLFKSDAAGPVTLQASAIINAAGSNFGFTIFKGMDGVTTYNHHGSWNAGNNTQAGAPDSASSPYTGAVNAGTGLPVSAIVAYSVGGASPGNLNSITFNAEANQIYTIFLGGYRNGNWGTTNDGYSLSISQAGTAPVPLPAAVWLLASALAGMGVFGRRKGKSAE